MMLSLRRQVVNIYVDHATQQWVVRDSDGDFWIIPAGENAWEERQPFELTEQTDLEPIPGHYKYLLQLPF